MMLPIAEQVLLVIAINILALLVTYRWYKLSIRAIDTYERNSLQALREFEDNLKVGDNVSMFGTCHHVKVSK